MTKSKGRRSKFTPEQVAEIAKLSARGLSAAQIAIHFAMKPAAMNIAMWRRGLHARPKLRKEKIEIF